MDYINYYLNNNSNRGGAGMAFEVAVREALLGIIEKCHGADETDIVIKRGVALECKSGCGWLREPVSGEFGFVSRLDAETALADKINALYDNSRSDWSIMAHAKHVAYIEKFDGSNVAETRIMTQKAFLRMLADNNLIRVKQSRSSGLWGFAIQSYIPTPKFRASRDRYERVRATWGAGMTINDYAIKMGLV